MMKVCLACGVRVIGREDKKFCSDGCRNTYNNSVNKDCTNLMRTINNRLRKNYKLLCLLNKENKTKVHRSKLVEGGFDFDLVTSVYTTKTGNTYRFLYNQGYMYIDNDYYVLVRKE